MEPVPPQSNLLIRFVCAEDRGPGRFDRPPLGGGVLANSTKDKADINIPFGLPVNLRVNNGIYKVRAFVVISVLYNGNR